MRHIALVAAAALLAATQAQALSCLRPDPAASFQWAAASEDIYVVLRGSLSFDINSMPASNGAPRPEDLPAVPARFSGHALNAQGFVIPYQTELLLQPTCAGPWCGSATPAEDMVAFARDNGAGIYVIDLDPCGTTVFADPTPEVIATITACMAGGDCTTGR